MAFKIDTRKAVLKIVKPTKNTIKLMQIENEAEDIVFWSIFPPNAMDNERLLKVRTFPYPLKEGWYGKKGEDYLNPTDVWAIKKEVKELK
jgi:hypothetical protein